MAPRAALMLLLLSTIDARLTATFMRQCSGGGLKGKRSVETMSLEEGKCVHIPGRVRDLWREATLDTTIPDNLHFGCREYSNCGSIILGVRAESKCYICCSNVDVTQCDRQISVRLYDHAACTVFEEGVCSDIRGASFQIEEDHGNIGGTIAIVIIVLLLLALCVYVNVKPNHPCNCVIRLRGAEQELQTSGEQTTTTTTTTVAVPATVPQAVPRFDPNTGQPIVQMHQPSGRFDPMTGQPIPKFDPLTGKQNWYDAGEVRA